MTPTEESENAVMDFLYTNGLTAPRDITRLQLKLHGEIYTREEILKILKGPAGK